MSVNVTPWHKDKLYSLSFASLKHAIYLTHIARNCFSSTLDKPVRKNLSEE